MSLASLFGGIALANARLGAVHGFAGPIGGLFSAPHGMICACLLPLVMQTNLDALEKRDHANSTLDRYDEIARLMTGHPRAEADDGVSWVFDLREELEIPSLGNYGIQTGDIPVLIEKARQASSMKGNPIVLTDDEMHQILEKAL
jgi:alcohol dehydrogenase class IV